MKAACLALLFVPAVSWAQPASRPAPADSYVGPESVQGQVTIIFELDEHHLKVQESWQLHSAGPVRARTLVFPLGNNVRRLRLDEDTKGFEANDIGTTIGATQDLGTQASGFAGSYLLDFDGDTAVIERSFPVPVVSGRVILEAIDGLNVSGSTQFGSRQRDLNGLSFKIFDFGGLPAGHKFQLRIGGLPSRSGLPRKIAVFLSCLAFVGMVVALVLPSKTAGRTVLGALSAEARRDQVVRAIELLEEDRKAGRIEGKKHERRRKALMNELAAILREIDLARAARARS